MISTRLQGWLPTPRTIHPAFSLWLDLFRWLAALAVCTSHLRAAVFMDYSPQFSWLVRPFYFVTGFGYEAVLVFFVLSGYLVGGEVLRGLRRGDFDGRVYACRRLGRLYAVYVAALLLGALWDHVGLHFLNDRLLYTAAAPTTPMFFFSVAAQLNWPTFAGNLVFCQTLLVPPFGSNHPLWSLANEAWYYLLFPLVAGLLWGRGAGRMKLAGLLVLVAVLWFVRGDLLNYFLLWLVGAGLHFLPRAVLRGAWIAPLALAASLALARFHVLDVKHTFPGDLLIAVTFALWLNYLEHRPVNPPGPPALHRRLAGFSYTLYLVHWPLLLLLTALCDQWFNFGCRMAPDAVALVFAAGLLVIVYGYAWGVAQLTERHTARWRDVLLRVMGRSPAVLSDR